MTDTDEDTSSSSTTTSIIEAAKRRILEANVGIGNKRRQSKDGCHGVVGAPWIY